MSIGRITHHPVPYLIPCIYIFIVRTWIYLFDKDSSTPLWNYETGHYVRSVSISADGEYITVGSNDKKVYLFEKDSSTPLWSYTTGNYVLSVGISADGEYITAGSMDENVYALRNDPVERPSLRSRHQKWSGRHHNVEPLNPKPFKVQDM